jgi:hypothetical protein
MLVLMVGGVGLVVRSALPMMKDDDRRAAAPRTDEP